MSRGIGQACWQVVGIDILEVLVNPPQVTLGVANASHALTEREGCHGGDLARPGRHRTVDGGLSVVDVDAKMRRSRGQPG